jgi:hypothetical protein
MYQCHKYTTWLNFYALNFLCFSLIKMKSSGILQRLQLRWVPQSQQCDTVLRVATGWTDVVPPVTGLVGSVIASLCILTVELMLYKYKCRKVIMPHHKNKIMNTLQIYPAGNLHKHPTRPNRNLFRQYKF